MKFYSIRNNNFEVTVNEVGAELSSFKSLITEKEYIWKADPDVWASHAPNLFPIIGCLKGDSFWYKGKEYACPKHGFLRKNTNVILVTESENKLTFGLKYSQETLEVYPFKFEFEISFVLNDNRLDVEHKVINHGDEEMLFSLGGHPGFTCPINEGEQYADYYLEFDSPETAQTWRVLESGLIGKETSPVFDTSTQINLHPQIFKNDALVFKNLNSSKVTLKSRKSSHEVSMSLTDFPYLGIWAKPNAPYVCIEPWIGIADSNNSNRKLEEKEGLMKLGAAKSFLATYSILITE